jgi:plasmid stabilization system protein ParE
MRRLKFVGATWRQFGTAARWWRRHRDKAADAFDDDFAVALTLIRREPGVGVPVATRRIRNVRRFHLERIRYYIYYHVVNDAIHVLAIRHPSRRPPRL